MARIETVIVTVFLDVTVEVDAVVLVTVFGFNHSMRAIETITIKWGKDLTQIVENLVVSMHEKQPCILT